MAAQVQYDTIILGGGPAGYTAALYAARAGLAVLVVEKMVAGGQMSTTLHIDNYPGAGAGVDGFSLGEAMQKQAEAFGAQTLFAEVTAVQLSANPKTITTTEGNFTARSVILATGASPRKLGLPQEEALTGHGLAYCAACDGMFYKGKTVAVLGGGNSAAEDALYLAGICRKVYLIHRRDALRADSACQQALKAAGIEFLGSRQLDAFASDGSNLTGLILTDKHTGLQQTLSVDGAFVAIGRTPRTALFAAQLSLDSNGYIRADESTCTALPGVYAAGDIRTKPLRQIVTAVADGAVAASQAAAWLHANF